MAYLLLAVLLIASFHQTQTCSCVHSTRQHLYCNADYVVLVKVKQVTIPADEDNQDSTVFFISTADEKIYTVKLKKIYKGDSALSSLNTSAVYSVRSGASCGIDLTVGQKYILGGFIREVKMMIYSCDLVLQWNSLEYKRLLKKYHVNCDCQTTVCNGCGVSAGVGLCTLDASIQSIYSCLDRSGYCATARRGKCKWKSFADCFSISK